MGIFYIATGHYVQKVELEGTYYITHAADPDKDQSFFSMGVEARYTSADTVADGGILQKLRLVFGLPNAVSKK